MKDEAKTKLQLIRELIEMRQQIANLKELEEISEEMRNTEARYLLLEENLSDVVWTMDLSLRFTYYSSSVIKQRGHTPEEAMAMTLQETLTPASFHTFTKAIEEEFTLEKNEPKDISRTRVLELEEYCKDSSTIWVEAKVSFLRDQEHRLTGFQGITRDITERKQYEDTIKQLAFFDQVTGLPNRVLFNDRLGMAVRNARRNRKQLAVMMLDLDRFKDINDTFGHTIGDELLHNVGHRIKELLRDTDTIGRTGGDEFLILLPSINCEGDVTTVAKKIIVAFQEPFVIDSKELRITASIGASIYPKHGSSVDTLVKNADTAMYMVKAMDRNNWQLFNINENIL